MKDERAHSPLMVALEQFEATEANLAKLERLWVEIGKLTPKGIEFGSNSEYEDRSRSYEAILAELPNIDGWKPDCTPLDLDDLAQARLDASELYDVNSQVSVEKWIEAPGRDLREYRFRLNNKRRALIRDALVELIDLVDTDVRSLRQKTGDPQSARKLDADEWKELREHIKQIEVLLGSSVDQPLRWRDLRRHMNFADPHDLSDIETIDWPQAKQALRSGLYGVNDPLPVAAGDLSDLVNAHPRGAITSELNWSNLNDENFERLIFNLISDEPGYENPEWLTRTRAPDRGRDLSVVRLHVDRLSGTLRQRVVIQCKHWLSKSVGLQDISNAKAQMALWRDPRVDVLVIATSGRFTTDALQWVEHENAKGESPRIDLWAESHLERLLTARPALIGEFGLRLAR